MLRYLNRFMPKKSMLNRILRFASFGFWLPLGILVAFASTIALLAYMWTYIITPSGFLEYVKAMLFTFLGGILVFIVLVSLILGTIVPFVLKNKLKKMNTLHIHFGPPVHQVKRAPPVWPPADWKPDDEGDIDIKFRK